MLKMLQVIFDGKLLLTIFSRVLSVLLNLVVTVITAQSLGPAGRGIYFFITTTGKIIAQFCYLGLQVSNTYTISQDKTKAMPLLANTVWISIGVGLFATAIGLWSLQRWGAYPDTITDSLTCLYLFVPATVFYLLGLNFLIALDRVVVFNLFQLTSDFIVALAMIIAVLLSWKVRGLVWVNSSVWLIMAAILFIVLIYQNIFSWRFDSSLWRSTLAYGMKAYTTTLLCFLAFRSNVYLLQHYASSEQVGYYSIAFQFHDALSIIPTSLGLLLLPKLVKQDHQDAWHTLLTNLYVMGALLLIFCVMIVAIAKPLITVAFGTAFLPVIPILKAIFPCTVMYGLITVLIQYLSAAGFPRGALPIWVLGFMMTLLTSVLWVPRYQALGAAWALSVSFISIFLLLFGLACWLKYEYRLQ